MNEQHKYCETEKMSDLICDNYSLLMVMSRFGLSLGFGDKSVKEVCEAQGVDCPTFLAVANFISKGQCTYSKEGDRFSISALMDYLKRAHTYFLDFNLPLIRRKLIEAIDCSDADNVAYLILKFFDEYAKEVRRHMEYENQAVFTYVEKLLQGCLSDDYDIATFASKHNQIDTKLKELKNIIIKYYPEKGNDNLLNAVLFDIFNCEHDLATHCQVEDYLFVPAVAQIERRLRDEHFVACSSAGASTTRPECLPRAEGEGKGEGDEQESLSLREKEIIACVAKGMINKVIADRLCLSVHTVITHRRNIARKLQIHSPAGLTIYAIVNKLVKLSDIKEVL